MTGFTRLLVSNNGQPDGLMHLMPTLLVPQLGFDKTKGFQVIPNPNPNPNPNLNPNPNPNQEARAKARSMAHDVQVIN